MDKITLVKPDQAQGEVAEIFADIQRIKGDRYLTPTWGFFALDVDLLRHWWGLTKRLQMMDGDLPQTLRNAISLICASEVDCPRCINNHQTHLIEHFGMDADDVAEILDFENSDKVDVRTKAVLRFARKMAFTEGLADEDFQALRDNGVTDRGVAEIVSMAMMESGMARHAVGVAQFEDGDAWPRTNLPSAFYGDNVNR
ncbi:carboxymuconolactone decarboxylase family protein [Castellaniella sp.]|uniref:carboxymuconolactone decarboxylase family protein n=1 Tax=Castellaniella sp. TaxID=1955812 RepID=UPI003C75B613